MVEYRRFRNSDPPHLLRLFSQAGLGRGAAKLESLMQFELSALSFPYFDPEGLIVAEANGRRVGYVHAGFGFTSDLQALDYSQGVIAAIFVDPKFQHQRIGRELVARAEQYLLSRGARSIQAGQSKYRDPFYLGIYGGARPSGFLDSDPGVGDFFLNLGYEPQEVVTVFQRDLKKVRDPVNIRLITIRRQTNLTIHDRPSQVNWWWYTHFANFETMRFVLSEKKTQIPIAAVTVLGLDNYISSWNHSAIGLVDIHVAEKFRGQGYGQALLVETFRKLRTDLISLAEIHVPKTADVACAAVKGAGFTAIDRGTVYAKPM